MAKYSWTTITSETQVNSSIITELINNTASLQTDIAAGSDPGNFPSIPTTGLSKNSLATSGAIAKLYQKIDSLDSLVTCNGNKSSNYPTNNSSQKSGNNGGHQGANNGGQYSSNKSGNHSSDKGSDWEYCDTNHSTNGTGEVYGECLNCNYDGDLVGWA